MEKRLALAIILMIAVAVLPSLLFRPPPRGVPGDSTRALPDRPAVTRPQVSVSDTAHIERPPPAQRSAAAAQEGEASDTITVVSPLYRYRFSGRGGRLIGAWLTGYQSFTPGDSGTAQLVRQDSPLLTQRLVMGMDTVDLTEVRFTADQTAVNASTEAAGFTLEALAAGLEIRLTYRFRPDDYRFEVRGEIGGLPPTGAVLAVGLGSGLRSVDADTLGDYRTYAVVTKANETSSLSFGRLDPGEADTLAGPFEWVATKSKYFLAAALAVHPSAAPFGGVLLSGGARTGKAASRLDAVATLPVSQSGSFGYDMFLGPQEHRRLHAIGHGLQDVNPYGWVLRPIIRPIAAVVVGILVWLHERLNLAYGWVLVLFGLGIRILLWPLNQKAMESSARMQAVAPLMKDLQDRHRNDPQRLQQEMMRLYREHRVNPMGGCLPMLLPMPVLFALFFVFANTIEFRGVPFLWLPDLSRPDPLYIIPVLMGLSMFALMKIGQRSIPASPQQKQQQLLMYFMPVVMTVLFLNFASGLNLYYAATNVFSLPQQWLIAKRRAGMPTTPAPASAKAVKAAE